ncbi:Sugar transferase involved in LPS biosynthesis (colanic, teichoic acid) [Planococcus glaciei]|uniref:sugar transferase n=1 Tax=Planococcus glaciei TaxID=459472 RepID=UPI00088BA157|nr:sugar transferase [Planococcus glaciei]SDI33877.1 Sugar transferase involved in LPS biosynthesis (colanic, teichoic acid) [Planococcus glaciei]
MAVSNPERTREILISETQESAQYLKEINDARSYLIMKRIIDVLGAIAGIILLFPLLLLVYFAIKIEDPRHSAFFSQTRVGKNGREFVMYKFRSMVCNAEEMKLELLNRNEATGPVFKIRLDPRITFVGKFIRKTSMDELPQLINVLKGEMSLVGPRPPLPEEVKTYTLYEHQRLNVIPGLTCYWQVSGRSNVRFEEWIEMDLKYVSEHTIWIDFKLIFKTFFVLFGSKDAY